MSRSLRERATDLSWPKLQQRGLTGRSARMPHSRSELTHYESWQIGASLGPSLFEEDLDVLLQQAVKLGPGQWRSQSTGTP